MGKTRRNNDNSSPGCPPLSRLRWRTPPHLARQGSTLSLSHGSGGHGASGGQHGDSIVLLGFPTFTGKAGSDSLLQPRQTNGWLLSVKTWDSHARGYTSSLSALGFSVIFHASVYLILLKCRQ